MVFGAPVVLPAAGVCCPLGGRRADVQVVSASSHSGDGEIALDRVRGGAGRGGRPGCVAGDPGQGGGAPRARAAGGGFEWVAATPSVVGASGVGRWWGHGGGTAAA